MNTPKIPISFKVMVGRGAPALLKMLRLPRFMQGVLRSPMQHAPGHYYSPIPSYRDIEQDRERIFSPARDELLAIDLNDAVQDGLRTAFAQTYGELPYTPASGGKWRYRFDNAFFFHSDAVVLYSMMRHLAPRRVVEVGSGYSSAVMLDTNDAFLGGRTQFSFIDPNPQRLLGLLTEEDRKRHTVLPSRVQDVELGLFESLGAGDILFIDSSHVAKAGSDVNWLVFEVLPRLQKGVFIHIHDVFHPFEYPETWVRAGFSWNEAYLIRAFLMYNRAFEIVYHSSYQEKRHKAWFEQNMPLCLERGGQSIWLRAVDS